MRREIFRLTMVVCAIVSTALIHAQHTEPARALSSEEPGISCASDFIHQAAMLRYDFSTAGPSRRTAVTIPLVVHIMHTGEDEGIGSNISDEQIQSAVDGLNEDFRKMAGTNGDGAGVDVEFNFCLAARDPDGNPTDGINRINASSIPSYATEGITVGQGSGADETAVKALSRWPRADYYNIWIVNEIEDNDGGSGIQGYAYFPNSSASRDGTVCLYNAFGTVGTLKSYTSMNRTATHELGHAFYLYHTFQGSTCNETDCANQGDRVCDTPATTSNTSCNSPACSGTQQVENYMDYTSQTCQDMFTQGQKERMWANLDLYRSSLTTSNGCIPPNELDASISQVLAPQNYACASTFSPKVQLSNFGGSTLTSVDIKYKIDNGTTLVHTFNGSLASGESVDVSLPLVTTTDGAHTLTVYSDNPNGQTDQYQSNDQSTSSFEVVEGNQVTVSITVDNRGQDTTWEIVAPGGEVVAAGGPYPTGIYGTEFVQEVCLPLACYEFTIYDSNGDGIWGGYGFGSYSITDSDGSNLVQYETPDFTTERSASFCLSASTAAPTAEFTSNSTSGCGAETFSFTDLSTGSPTAWAWTFQGGSPSSSTQPNPSGISFSNSGPHDVTLTVSNANGSNTEFKNDFITIGAGPIINGAVTNTTCEDEHDGAINLTVGGGTPPYNYDWSHNSSNQDVMFLAAGVYTVTVTDNNGCSSTETFLVSSPSALAASTSSTEAGCNTNGIATVSVTGGTSPYTYLWDDPNMQTGSTANGLSSGAYLVVVTDANGCQVNASAFIGSTSGVEIENSSSSPSSCSNDGSATVFATGGAQPYQYEWNTGQSTATITGIGAGQYTVTVIDANDCQDSETITVSATGGVDIASITSTPASCTNDGTAMVSANGGAQPYQYAWNTGQATSSISGLVAGQYTVTVTDANGCQASGAVTVASEGGVDIVNIVSTSATCTEDGTASVTANGGAQPYQYFWDTGQATASISNLGAGEYSVMVTDANGCQANAAVVVVSEGGVEITDVQTTPSSCAYDGTASITATGGAQPYQYIWSNGEFTSSISGVAAGDYNVTVTDANGCFATTAVTVEEFTPLTIQNFSTNPASCTDDGSATVFAAGGEEPYTYLWSDDDMQTTATAVELGAGDYTVIVTDANGCQEAMVVTIDGTPGLNLSNTMSGDATCTNDGWCGVEPSGGTPPYSYLWNNPEHSMTSTITDLEAGSYVVTVTDANGCGAVALITISGGQPINLDNTSSTTASCTADGTATVTPTGGTPPYQYVWNDTQAQQTATATGLAGGNYQVTVTDVNGCSASRTVMVNSNSTMDLSGSTATATSCFGASDGSVTAVATGGSGSYTYLWNDPAQQTTATAVGLSSRAYAVTVTDSEGCQAVWTIDVPQPEEIQVSFIVEEPSCFGIQDANLAAFVTGGTAPYELNWTDGSTEGLERSALAAGQYNLIVTDAVGCTSEAMVEITEPTEIHVEISSSTPDSCNLNTGEVVLDVTGGTGTLSVFWNDANQQQGTTLSHVRFGNYTALVRDANVCEKTKPVVVEEVECGSATSINEFEDVLEFSLYPNPLSGETLRLRFAEAPTEEMRVTLLDVTGKLMQEATIAAHDVEAEVQLNDSYATGVYYVQLQAGHQLSTRRLMIYR